MRRDFCLSDPDPTAFSDSNPEAFANLYSLSYAYARAGSNRQPYYAYPTIIPNRGSTSCYSANGQRIPYGIGDPNPGSTHPCSQSDACICCSQWE
ncbi:hypothetical protein KDK_39400 [Dictyobacter kobayashii]|uniref:Uncharacterized protein n=1 Tax=Dictyobacter kobayashii TaxID=2014872 RepID=A0A402AMC1_9CHLR|nr:hypothetical protein KDK_39400 [Dictyobacter kobayashii]